MEQEENILGKEKIGKLIRKFSIPCIISLLVNSLYNIVDQIFIGQGVGYLGNGATNVVFPIVIIGLAFSLMLGDGASAYLSLKLGEKKKEDAELGIGNGIGLAVIVSAIFCAITLIFLPQLLNIFGCTENLRAYATSYGRIIAIGLPFSMIGTTLNSIIRADGSPKYSMATMVIGAVLNTILDPIFIFVFHKGVEGAAVATVISQFVTFILNVIYIRKFKSIKITRKTLKLKLNVCKRVAGLGISSFITQMSFVCVMAIENNLLGKYGAESKFGAEIPITVFGIVMKISQILNSIIIGLTAGSQPIFGYNYGARKFDRVKQTLKIVLGSSVVISTIAFILFQTIPDKLILIFGSGDENYMEFACLAFRIYLLLCIFNGIQIPSGIFFQAIGKSTKSAILSLSRQIILLIPAMVILSKIFGVMGVLYSGPVADSLAFILAIVLLIQQMRHLQDNETANNSLVDDTSTDNKLSKHIVITVSREYGSGGRYIGRLIADKLGIKLYDKDFILKVAEQTGLSAEYIENNEQKRNTLSNLNNGYYSGLNNADELFIKESELIKKVANEQSCVIIGRCADFILKDKENTIKVFVYSNMNNKIKRATKIYGIDKNKAEKELKRIDKLRANHYKHYTEQEWSNPSNYDICINSDVLGVEKSADIICQMVTNIIQGLSLQKQVTLRINTIKSNKDEIKEELNKENIIFKDVSWYEDALIIQNAREEQIQKLDIYEQGKIYLQSLSSMLPPIVLNPQENENILDMAAAPGGKTTQIAALSKNKAFITACERNKIRGEKLKYNLQKQGATHVNVMLEDAGNLSDFFSFDKILLDAPCSGSGTENVFKSNFSKELIEKIDIESNVSLIPIKLPEEIKCLGEKINGTVVIAPNELFEGFFIAKLRKNV